MENANRYRRPPPRSLLLVWCHSGEPPKRLDDDIVFKGSEDDKFLALHQPTIRSTGNSYMNNRCITLLTACMNPFVVHIDVIMHTACHGGLRKLFCEPFPIHMPTHIQFRSYLQTL